jgi:tripartite-type tricarboxylate transporter receptor subunit TctC
MEGMMGLRLLRPALLAFAALLGSYSASGVHAETPYPSRTIKLIVPNPPGGLPDVIARLVGRRLQERLGRPVVVENRPGASAGIGAAALMSAPADGYTFLLTDGAIFSVNPLIQAKLPYDPKDIVPVALIARAPIFLAANANIPVANMKDFIAYAKAHSGKLSYGSIGVGSFHHLSMEAIESALGLKLIHVPFKGSGESVGAFLGGHIDLVFASYAALQPGVASHQAKLLATNGPQRAAQAPDVPSLAEFIPGYDLSVIQGLLARAGTPKAAVDKIAAEVKAIVQEADIVRQFAVAGIEPIGASSEAYDRALQAERKRVAAVVQSAGIKMH